MKRIIKRFQNALLFFKIPEELKRYKIPFKEELNRQAYKLHRWIGIMAIFGWTGYAFQLDPELHPEFPELFYFRIGLSICGIILTVASFIPSLRGKGLGWLYFIGAYFYILTPIFTARLADDAAYMSGYMLVLLLPILGPFPFASIVLFYLISIITFVISILAFQPVLNNQAYYSFQNLGLAIMVGLIFGYFIYRFRFRGFVDKQILEITKEDVEKANEKLQELDKAKTDFFTNISHEFRTPLTLILSPIESVLQGDYEKEIDNSFFKNLQKNAIRLLKLVNTLLELSKIEAGKMDMKVRETDIVLFIKNYIETVKEAFYSKRLNLKFVSSNDSIENLYLDREKTDKIVMNLFSNGLKYTERGGEIKILVTDDDKNCYIEYKDTGIGIPADKLESVFDRFSQVDSGSTRKFEGTGIGLALVKEYIEMHDGKISLQSKFKGDFPDSHGTTIVVTLPKGKKHFENREGVEFITDIELNESVSGHRFVGMREMIDLKESEDASEPEDLKEKQESLINILIVEDNRDMRYFLKILLQNYYTIHLAENGKEGLKKAREISPDLIVTDVMMPIMNGYEMTRIIKEDEELKRIPVLMLTARTDISHKIEGLEYGANDYLTKPFNSKELLARMKSLLKTYEYEKIISARNLVIENELKTARLLQQKLLPEKLSEISGYRSHVTYIPMDKVGGDFYDYKANDDFIELFIADVSGHGLPGAFFSMITKIVFESIRERKSTRDVLNIINDVICRSTVENNYVTTFYCIIDRKTNIMIYSNAGHLPPLAYRKNNDVFFEFCTKGNPLGWFENLKLEEKEMQLCSGDRLILYTDGITECMDSNKIQFGEDGFKEFIRSNISLSPKLFSESLLDYLKTFSGSDKFDDDLCLLVFDLL